MAKPLSPTTQSLRSPMPGFVTCAPTSERIVSCSCCGLRGYSEATLLRLPEVKLFDMKVVHPGHNQSTTMTYCDDCLQEISQVIFPFRKGS